MNSYEKIYLMLTEAGVPETEQETAPRSWKDTEGSAQGKRDKSERIKTMQTHWDSYMDKLKRTHPLRGRGSFGQSLGKHAGPDRSRYRIGKPNFPVKA